MFHEAMVLLAVLCTVDFLPKSCLPPSIHWNYELVHVPADGRCFWYCIFVATQLSMRGLFGWSKRPRSSLGFCGGQDEITEREMMLNWLTRLDLPDQIRQKITKAESVEDEEIDPGALKIHFLKVNDLN